MPKYTDEYIERRRDWWMAGFKFVSDANYKKAVDHCKKGLKLFPNDVVVEFKYYSVLCDYYLTNTKSKHTVERKKTIAKMKTFLNKLKGQPVWAKNYIKNEYYFQSQSFKKQYELGVNEYKKTKDKYELYSAGVGGAQYALVLAKKGQKKRAESWAKRSIKAWEVYVEFDKKYYNSYVHYALAWGVLGDEKKMMWALRESAKRCKKPLSYKEFQDVINEVGLL